MGAPSLGTKRREAYLQFIEDHIEAQAQCNWCGFFLLRGMKSPSRRMKKGSGASGEFQLVKSHGCWILLCIPCYIERELKRKEEK